MFRLRQEANTSLPDVTISVKTQTILPGKTVLIRWVKQQKLSCKSHLLAFETLSYLLITQTGCVVLITGIGQEVDKDGLFFFSLHDQRRTCESILPGKDVHTGEGTQKKDQEMCEVSPSSVQCEFIPGDLAPLTTTINAGLQSPPDGATHEAAEATGIM